MKVAAKLLAVFLVSCAATLSIPTKEQPRAACLISCREIGGSWMFRRQHLCRGSTREFEDIKIIGEYTVRAADGTLSVDQWLLSDGRVVDKLDVENGSCSSYISGLILLREPTQRGQHPGEDPLGNPAPPQ